MNYCQMIFCREEREFPCENVAKTSCKRCSKLLCWACAKDCGICAGIFCESVCFNEHLHQRECQESEGKWKPVVMSGLHGEES